MKGKTDGGKEMSDPDNLQGSLRVKVLRSAATAQEAPSLGHKSHVTRLLKTDEGSWT